MAGDPGRRDVLRGIAGGLVPLAVGSGTVADAVLAADSSADAAAQSITRAPSLAWEATGDSGRDRAIAGVVPSANGGIVSVGTESVPLGPQNALITETVGAGEQRWTTTVGGDDTDTALGVARDGDAIMAVGGSLSAGSDSMDTALFRVTADGDHDWTETVGHASDGNDAGHEIVPANDDGFVIGGGTEYLGASTGDGAGRIAKVDADGERQWAETYDADYAGEIYDLVATDDGYAFAGTRATDAGGGGDLWVGRIDESGALQMSETYGRIGERVGNSIVAVDDGFAVAGTTAPPGSETRAWILRLGPDGELRWERVFGGAAVDVASSIDTLPRGGYSVAGWSASGADDQQAWLLELDGDGEQVWSQRFGDEGVDRFTDHVRTARRGYVAGGRRPESGRVAGWTAGVGGGEDAVAPARRLDATSFLDVFPGEIEDTIGAEVFAEDSIETVLDAEAAGTAPPEVSTAALERLSIGQGATRDFLEFASPAGGSDALNYTRRIAEYLVGVITDLIMEQLALGEKLTSVVPDRLTRAIDTVGEQFGGDGESALSVDFFDDLIDTVLDLALNSGDIRSETLWRISSSAEDVFNDLWDQTPDAVRNSAGTAIDLVKGAIDALNSVIARLIQAGYETGALDMFLTLRGTPSANDTLPEPADEPVGRSMLLDAVEGPWQALWRLHDEVPATVEAGESLSGTTEAARRAREGTVPDIREDMENSGGWLDLIVEDLISFGIMENLMGVLGAIKEILFADGILEVTQALFDGAIDLIQGVLGIVTKKVELLTSLGAAFVCGDILRYTAEANVAVVESVIEGTDEVDLVTPYDFIPPVDETVPEYEAFKDAI